MDENQNLEIAVEENRKFTPEGFHKFQIKK